MSDFGVATTIYELVLLALFRATIGIEPAFAIPKMKYLS